VTEEMGAAAAPPRLVQGAFDPGRWRSPVRPARSKSPNAPLALCTTPARSQAAECRNFRSVMKQFGEVRQAVAERKPKRWRRNAARRSGIAIRLNRANGTYSAA
jgi:hypothetical protein